MKVSTKLNNKVNELVTKITNFSSKLSTANESIDDLDKLVSQGDKEKESINKFTEKALKKFNKVKTFAKNFAEDAKEITDETEQVSARLESEVPAEATDEDKAEVKKFSRKLHTIHKRFSEITDNLNNITTEAEAVVNMNPDDAIKANKIEVTKGAESVDNGSGTQPEGTETVVQPNDIQTAAESVVNFSINNYFNFTVKNILKSFAEVKDDIEEAKDAASDVSEVITQEPEPQPAKIEETPPPTTESKTEKVEEAPKDEPKSEVKNMTEEEIETLANDTETFGQEAIMKNDEAAVEELDKKLEDLESKVPGKGEEVMTKLENFSKNYKIFKEFSSKSSTNIFDQIKEFSATACEGAIKKSVDADELGAKAEQLEKNQPGAGELLTTVIECFGKIIKSLPKVPNATECPVTAPEFNPKNFCGDIESFVNDINVEDKRFCRDVKSACFALQNAIEDNDQESIKKNTSELAKTLDKSEDESVKSFGEKLVKFAEELAASESKPKDEISEAEGAAAPEQIEKADQELNKVLDKLGEKGEQLKPEIATFAKKLCFAYKSMKCFTEEDLTKKLEAVEGLKKDFDENQKPLEEPKPETPTEPKKQESLLVEEVQRSPAELPSDASLKNFTQTHISMENDSLGYLASLDIR